MLIKNVFSFDWDEGNIGKNKKHDVEDREAEEAFFDEKRFIFKDTVHSQNEERLRILGKTKKSRLLFVVFTKRGDKIRIISARDINKKEVDLYEKKVSTPKI
ncbi:MAG: BrnT family toxin [Candidatus Levybacteria bacterium]|nr:BrnT family toxin [Candidatus Levybacteria bacterium]